jgi:hypothetical protein
MHITTDRYFSHIHRRLAPGNVTVFFEKSYEILHNKSRYFSQDFLSDYSERRFIALKWLNSSREVSEVY